MENKHYHHSEPSLQRNCHEDYQWPRLICVHSTRTLSTSHGRTTEGRGSSLPLEQDLAVVVQDVGVGVEQEDVVGHQGHHHDQHFQLIIYPQENRTGDQAQNAAVDEVLGQRNMADEALGSLWENAGAINTVGHDRAHLVSVKLGCEPRFLRCRFLLLASVVNACTHWSQRTMTQSAVLRPRMAP